MCRLNPQCGAILKIRGLGWGHRFMLAPNLGMSPAFGLHPSKCTM